MKLRELMIAAVLTGLLCVGLSAQSNRQPSYMPPRKGLAVFSQYSGDQVNYAVGPGSSFAQAGYNCAWGAGPDGKPRGGLMVAQAQSSTTCGPLSTGTWNTTNAAVWWDFAKWGYVIQQEAWITTLNQPGDAFWVYGYVTCDQGEQVLGYLPFNGIC